MTPSFLCIFFALIKFLGRISRSAPETPAASPPEPADGILGEL